MNGAEKMVAAMKKLGQKKTPGSQITTLTVSSLKPLIFKLENRLEIDSDFYELSNLEDWNDLKIGDKVRGFSFNEGQKYFINEKISNSGRDSIEKQLSDIIKRLEALESKMNGG